MATSSERYPIWKCARDNRQMERKHYRFTEAQKQALEYYQKLEESLRFNDEARKYLKELL